MSDIQIENTGDIALETGSTNDFTPTTEINLGELNSPVEKATSENKSLINPGILYELNRHLKSSRGSYMNENFFKNNK